MVGADRTCKMDIIKCLHNFIHIKASIGGKMCRFLKVTGEVVLQIADVGKVDASLKGADHSRKIIVRVGAIGAGTEGHAVVAIIHHLHHPLQIGQVNDDSGKTKHAPGRIVRMNCHINVVFVTDRHDSFQEVFQIGKECFLVHILVHFKELLDFRHALTFPAGQDKTIGVGGNGIKHFHRIDAVHSLLAISKYRGAVRAYSCKLSAGPVKDRHEIVAYKMNILFAKAL